MLKNVGCRQQVKILFDYNLKTQQTSHHYDAELRHRASNVPFEQEALPPVSFLGTLEVSRHVDYSSNEVQERLFEIDGKKR